MKFRLSGNQQPPEWVLAEVNILIQLEDMNILSQLCHIISQHLLHSDTDSSGKNDVLFDGEEGLAILQEVARLGAWSSSDSKTVSALLRYILTNCAKYKLSDDVIKQELGQLGLSPQQCDTIVQVFRQFSGKLRRKLIDASFMQMRVDTHQPIDWRVDYVLQARDVTEVNQSAIKLSLPLRKHQTTTPLVFDVSQPKFEVLVHELRQAKQLMKDTAAKLK